MSRSTKESWLQGSGDLKEADVEDVPVPGESVRVRGLAAKFSAEIQSQAKLTQEGRESVLSVDQATIERLTFAHGVIDPQFTEHEAGLVQEKFGPAFKKVVGRVNELSGVEPEDVEASEARFPDSGTGSNGSGGGDTPGPEAVETPSQVGGGPAV